MMFVVEDPYGESAGGRVPLPLRIELRDRILYRHEGYGPGGIRAVTIIKEFAGDFTPELIVGYLKCLYPKASAVNHVG